MAPLNMPSLPPDTKRTGADIQQIGFSFGMGFASQESVMP